MRPLPKVGPCLIGYFHHDAGASTVSIAEIAVQC